jgi:hypothetical protein
MAKNREPAGGGSGRGGNTPPKDGKSTTHGRTCGAGHAANSEGKCFTAGCAHYVR